MPIHCVRSILPVILTAFHDPSKINMPAGLAGGHVLTISGIGSGKTGRYLMATLRAGKLTAILTGFLN